MSESDTSIRIGKRTFLTATAILGLLMVAVGILTRVVPSGSYDRTISDGREVIVQGTFHFTQAADFPIWRWFTAPIEVLWSADGPTVIVIIFFLLAIAGAISLLDASGVMTSVIARIVRRFARRRFFLMSVIVFLFMLMGAILGTFEENIALVPIIIALAYSLGWDSLMGLGMSVLASCFGFTAAITNPFSITITQQIADLPLYSGSGLRVIIFLVFYAMIMGFLLLYARRIEKNPEKSLVFGEDTALRHKYSGIESLEKELGNKSQEQRHKLNRAIALFGGFILLLFAVMLAANFIPGLSDLTLPLIGLFFLVGSIVSARTAGLEGRRVGKVLLSSCGGIAPGIVLILMAMSIKHIISNGGIMDTILYYAAGAISNTSPIIAIILIYILILLLELFIGSSSAKAFLIMPLIAPLSDLVGITRQTSILAFSFGDGFSNVLYPTNPVLLICLGLTVVTYPKWLKWTWKLQLLSFAMASVFLFIAVTINYGPY